MPDKPKFLDKHGRELKVGSQVIIDNQLYMIEYFIFSEPERDDYPRVRLVDSNAYWTEAFADEVELR